jgi:hypothetical protein
MQAAYFIGIVFIFALICVGIYADFDMGKNSAQGMKWFLVLPETIDAPELAVLTAYGDCLLDRPFDPSTKTIKETMYLLKMAEMSEIPLTGKLVGPFKFESPPTTTP